MFDFDLLNRITLFIPILMSLTVHEWAHARTAFALGDDTAYRLGRMTLNPLDHMDPIGTFALPLLGVPFGWAKPVPFEPTKFRQGISMDRGAMLVALAGPVSNFVLALLSAALFVAVPGSADTNAVLVLLQTLIGVNIMLGVFNLLPVFPLDGSHILRGLIPSAIARTLSYNSALSIGGLLVGLFLLGPIMQIWIDNLLSVLRILR